MNKVQDKVVVQKVKLKAKLSKLWLQLTYRDNDIAAGEWTSLHHKEQ